VPWRGIELEDEDEGPVPAAHAPDLGVVEAVAVEQPAQAGGHAITDGVELGVVQPDGIFPVGVGVAPDGRIIGAVVEHQLGGEEFHGCLLALRRPVS